MVSPDKFNVPVRGSIPRDERSDAMKRSQLITKGMKTRKELIYGFREVNSFNGKFQTNFTTPDIDGYYTNAEDDYEIRNDGRGNVVCELAHGFSLWGTGVVYGVTVVRFDGSSFLKSYDESMGGFDKEEALALIECIVNGENDTEEDDFKKEENEISELVKEWGTEA